MMRWDWILVVLLGVGGSVGWFEYDRALKELAACRASKAQCVGALQGSVRNTATAIRDAENAQDLLTAERADRDLERRLAGRPLAGSRAEWAASR